MDDVVVLRQVFVTAFAAIVAPIATGLMRRWQWGRDYSPSLTGLLALALFGGGWALVGEPQESLAAWLMDGLAAAGLGAVVGNVSHRMGERMRSGE